LVDRTIVSIHDRGNIDIAYVDINGHYEPTIIILKADESISPIKLIENPMLKSKVEDYQAIQDDSLKVNETITKIKYRYKFVWCDLG
jgi:hypothetical protein